MSDPQKNSKRNSKSTKAGNPLLDWIIRGVVFGVLGILMVLALMDFQAKQSATRTAEAWRNALRSKGENIDLTKSEFDKIAVTGSPAARSEKASPNSLAAVKMDTYTWKGTFRTYNVKVYFGMGNDPPVEQIEGP